MARRLLTTAVLAAAVLVAAGCGDSKPTTGSSAPAGPAPSAPKGPPPPTAPKGVD